MIPVATIAAVCIAWLGWCWVLVRRHEATATASASLRAVEATHEAGKALERAVVSDERATAAVAELAKLRDDLTAHEQRLQNALGRMAFR